MARIIKPPVTTTPPAIKRATAVVTRRKIVANQIGQGRESAEKKIKDLLEELQKEDTKLQLAEERVKQIRSEMQELMLSSSLTSVSGNAGQATMEVKFSNAKTTYDIAALHNKLPLNVFLECVEVVKAKLSKHLAPVELDGIATVTPGKEKPAELTIKLYKRKRDE